MPHGYTTGQTIDLVTINNGQPANGLDFSAFVPGPYTVRVLSPTFFVIDPGLGWPTSPGALSGNPPTIGGSAPSFTGTLDVNVVDDVGVDNVTVLTGTNTTTVNALDS